MTGNHGKRMVREDLIKKLEEKVVVAAKVANIKTLTNEQIDSLNCGDIVVKSENGSDHAYIVAYKKSDEMSLVYCDHENIEEVYYEKSGSNWAWVVTDNFSLKNYTAGDNITITDGVISATDTTYTAGDNITINNGVISATSSDTRHYMHDIKITYDVGVFMLIRIFNQSSSKFNKTSLIAYLTDATKTRSGGIFDCTYYDKNNATLNSYEGTIVDSGSSQELCYITYSGSSTLYNRMMYIADLTNSMIDDLVIED